ncbi:MAG: response regulator transcription factor [Chloroflexi bacterium]|nr:response regulator transcription factor [Chloroflexota bacterium]
MDRTIRVLLADDHPLVRAGIRTTLVAESDLALVGEATTGDEARRMCLESKPDVLLLDVQMPGPAAVQTVGFLRAECPEVKIVILTAHDSDTYVRGLISAGAAGYVLKDEAPQVVVRAIRTVMEGDTWFSKPVVEKMARLGRGDVPGSKPDALTEREMQVLQLVAVGKTDRQIGQELAVSERTVRHQLQGLCDKLAVNSRVELAVRATQLGLVGK